MPQKKKSVELILNVNETNNLLVMIIGCVVDEVFVELKTKIQAKSNEWSFIMFKRGFIPFFFTFFVCSKYLEMFTKPFFLRNH